MKLRLAAQNISLKNILTKMQIDRKLLEVLVVPGTHEPLEFNAQKNELVSRQAGLAFPVRNGIPIMLREEARVLHDSE